MLRNTPLYKENLHYGRLRICLLNSIAVSTRKSLILVQWLLMKMIQKHKGNGRCLVKSLLRKKVATTPVTVTTAIAFPVHLVIQEQTSCPLMNT